jgi:pimeloyl-ACP methyl ester carboxylesterase
MSQQLQHHFADVNGLHLHYVQQGNGKKLVVLLHGWPEFWYSWRNQIPVLAEHFTVIAPDLRGFADSDKPKGKENYHADIVAKDIVELIKHCGFDKAYIVGHDWGGAIAWTLAAKYDDVVEKLAVLNCPHPVLFAKALTSNIQQFGRSWYMFFFQLPAIPEFVLGNTLRKFFTQAFKGWMHNPNNISEQDIDKYVQAYRQKDALTTSINYYRAAISAAFSPAQRKENLVGYPKVKVPVQIIWGVDDKALGRELNDNLHKMVSDTLAIEWVENCSHWIMMDQPEIVNNTLIKFFLA